MSLLLHKAIYSIKSEVELKLKVGAVFKGLITIIPHQYGEISPNFDIIKLNQFINVVHKTGTNCTRTLLVSFIFPVAEVIGIKYAIEDEDISISKDEELSPLDKKDSNSEIEREELLLPTFIIKEGSKFLSLMSLLNENEVNNNNNKVCALSFEGDNIGKDIGILKWILLSEGTTIIVIDVEVLNENLPGFWGIMDECVFGNPKLIKVAHAATAISDYLFIKKNIKLNNVFDTEVADYILSWKLSGESPSKSKSISLAACLEKYNNGRNILPEELQLLRIFDEERNLIESQSATISGFSREYYKACAVKVKHLIALRKNILHKILKEENAGWIQSPK